jgi:hypothetical protein
MPDSLCRELRRCPMGVFRTNLLVRCLHPMNPYEDSQGKEPKDSHHVSKQESSGIFGEIDITRPCPAALPESGMGFVFS